MAKRKITPLQFLLVTTFLGQMIMGVVGIAVPIYANRLDASPFLVGLIGSAGGLIYSFMPLVSGRLSDKLNRKVFISASLISYGFSCLLYSLIEEPFMLIFIKVLEWLAVATFWPSMEALIADSTDVRLEETLRRFNISWGSAMIVGPMIGGVLISGYSVKAPFLFSLFISFAFGLLSLVIVKEPTRRREGDIRQIIESRDNIDEQGSIIVALASILLFSSIGGINLSLFPSYATDLQIPPYEIGLITFALGAARTVAFYHVNRIESRLGKLGTFLAGSLTLALASFLTSMSYNAFMFTVCFLVFGFGSGISYSASISFFLRRWKSSRGYAAGIFESLIGLGYFLGPLSGGIVSDIYAPYASYILSLFLSLVTCAVQLISSMGRSLKLRGTIKRSS